jgi:hypothetical protein
LQGDTEAVPAEGWDQVIPLELAVLALGDWTAKKTGQSVFQLILVRDSWAYSLVYRNAQPYHLLRIAADPRTQALRRLAGHADYLRQQTRDAGDFPVFLESGHSWKEDCAQVLGKSPEEIPQPPGSTGDAGSKSGLWHFGLALASLREEMDSHNAVSEWRQDRNLEIRLWDRLVKFSLLAVALGCAAILTEGMRVAWVDSRLDEARAEAERYSDKVESIQGLRRSRQALVDSLTPLRPLWERPAPLDRILRGLAGAMPSNSGMDGLLLREGLGTRPEISFRGWVDDWNRIRPVQDSLRKLPFFLGVELTEQRKESDRNRVSFQATCPLGDSP